MIKRNELKVRFEPIGYESVEFSVGTKPIPLEGRGLEVLKMWMEEDLLVIRQLRLFSITSPKDIISQLARLSEEGLSD